MATEWSTIWSFAKMFEMWLRTVLSESTSRRAITPFGRPAAIRSRISISPSLRVRKCWPAGATHPRSIAGPDRDENALLSHVSLISISVTSSARSVTGCNSWGRSRAAR
jgi:hypothetical protein